MKKIGLELDSLAVESLDTSRIGTERGTVRGHGTRTEPVDRFETQTTCRGTCFRLGTDYTACGQASCTCPPPPAAAGDPTCAGASRGLTYCVDTRDLCASVVTDSPRPGAADAASIRSRKRRAVLLPEGRPSSILGTADHPSVRVDVTRRRPWRSARRGAG